MTQAKSQFATNRHPKTDEYCIGHHSNENKGF